MKFLLLCLLSLDLYALCIIKDNPIVRDGPADQFKKVGQPELYTPLKALKKENEWYQVEMFDGDRFWIHQSDVTDKFECLIVIGNEVNLRTGPGVKYKKSPLGHAYRYDAFKILEKKGDWIRMTNEHKDIVWISKDFIQMY